MSDTGNKYLALSEPAFTRFVGMLESAKLPLSDRQRVLAKYAIASAYQDGVIATFKELLAARNEADQ